MTGNYFSNKGLLGVPNKRAAFSDRTAWVMAEMSRLAYFRFEGGNNIGDILADLQNLFPDRKNFQLLEDLLRRHMAGSDEQDAGRALELILKEGADFELVETFDSPETDAQGFLCCHRERRILVLAFRGTEKNLKDMKADVKAKLEVVEEGNRSFEIHAGYLEQFRSLERRISNALGNSDFEGFQLFLTGHSLGGALAITATKFLASDVTGACYTFGSPPVGTASFDWDIKTPIYRVVNHVDIVPRLPSPILVSAIRGLLQTLEAVLVPLHGVFRGIRESSRYQRVVALLLDAQRYRQSGYGSYLVGKGEKARLRKSVATGDKLAWWFSQIRNLFRGQTSVISDHSIGLYVEKLANWAEKRR